MKLAYTALAALALAVPAGGKDRPSDPETIACPPTTGDLDYALHRVMTSAKFDQDPYGGANSWRRREEGPLHLPSAGPAEWFKVEFKRFPTAAGTRIIADLRWQTRRYEFGVDASEPYVAFQEVLDGLAAAYPCVDGALSAQ